MPHIQRKFNAFVDGYSTHTECEGVTVPNLQDVLEETKAGGLIMGFEVPMGFQKMEAGIKVNSRQKVLMKRVGLVPGVFSRITFRSVNIDEFNGEQDNEVINITGRLNANNGGWEAQSIPKDDYKINSIPYYKHTINGEVIHHVDIQNFIGIVAGVDVWSSISSGLGL